MDDSTFTTADLFDAISGGDDERIREIFAHPNCNVSPDALDDGGCTALYRAAADGYTECALALLDAGASVNGRSNDPDTSLICALHAAIYNDCYETALALLDRGANPKIPDGTGATALHLAAAAGASEIDEEGMDAVVEIVRRSIKALTPIDQPDIDGNTPLQLAVRFGARNRIVKTLLEHGANVHCTNAEGNQAIHRVWSINNLDTLRLLVESGADISAMNFKNSMIWHFASDVATVDTLLNLGAAINQVDHFGANILLNVARRKDSDMLPVGTPVYMTEHRLDLGMVPVDVLAHMMERGLDLELPDYTGVTPMQYIASQAESGAGNEFASKLMAAITAAQARAAMRSATNTRLSSIAV